MSNFRQENNNSHPYKYHSARMTPTKRGSDILYWETVAGGPACKE